MNAMGQADIVGAGRQKTVVDAVVAEVALAGDAFQRIEFDGIVGAGWQTCLAAGALIHIEHHDAVAALRNGLIRAGVRTGRFVTMPAEVYAKSEIQFAVYFTRTILAHRDEFDAVRRTIFLFAGDLAGFAAPAQRMIDFERY